MKSISLRLCGLLGLFALTLSAAAQEPARLLFVTQSQGFRHGSVTRKGMMPAPAELAMTRLGIDTNLFRVDTTQDVAKEFTKERLDGYRIVMFYTTGDLPIEKETLEYFLGTWLKKKGNGFLGVHSATDTYHNYQPYWDMIGGTFNGHPWNASDRVTITVHDGNHPASKPWGEEFEITDEIYQFKNWQPEKVRVLMSLNMAKTRLKKPYHVPVLWVKNYGDGKVMHMSLGHREDVWENPKFLASLKGGVEWMLGKAEGSAEPNPDVSAEQEKKAKSDAGAEK